MKVKAKNGYKHDKRNSPHVGKWLKWYYAKRTCHRSSSYMFAREALEKIENVGAENPYRDTSSEMFRIANSTLCELDKREAHESHPYPLFEEEI